MRHYFSTFLLFSTNTRVRLNCNYTLFLTPCVPMTYKGYLGSVSYSEKDQVFFGKIEGINGLVNFEGESVKELTEAFHEAVDDYLAYCEDEGITPDKSYTGVLNVRLTPAIHRQIAMLALQAGLSINAYIKNALEEKVEMAVAG